MSYNKGNLFHHEGGKALEQVAQKSCEIVHLRNIQSLTGHGPEQPAPADPALNMGLDYRSTEVPSNLNCSVILNVLSGSRGEIQKTIWKTTGTFIKLYPRCHPRHSSRENTSRALASTYLGMQPIPMLRSENR